MRGMQAGVFVVAGATAGWLLCCSVEQLVVCVCAEREEEHMEVQTRWVGSCETGRREGSAKNRHTRRTTEQRGGWGGGLKTQRTFSANIYCYEKIKTVKKMQNAGKSPWFFNIARLRFRAWRKTREQNATRM